MGNRIAVEISYMGELSVKETLFGHTTVTTVSLAQDDTKTIDYIFESKQQF